MVFAHLLTVTNHTERYAIENRQGRWSSNPDFCYYANSITELADKTFGIVGLGNIGQRVAQIAQAFGMKVKAFTSKPAESLPVGIQKADLKELFQTSDIISLHCPLTPDTHHLIKAETIAWMNPETILINTGRGPLVDDAALAEALKAGRLKAYCADVMTEEPPKADNPLLQVDNAYITPHIAWATKEARQRLLQIATANVSAFLKGTPQNVRLYIGHLGIGGGYGFNWVPSRKWLIHLSMLPTFVIFNRNNLTMDGERVRARHMHFNMIFNERAAIIYNFSSRYFAGATLVMNNSVFSDDEVTVNQNKWRARALIGVRL